MIKDIIMLIVSLLMGALFFRLTGNRDLAMAVGTLYWAIITR